MATYRLEGGQYIGCHIGDMIYNYYIEQQLGTDSPIDIDSYRHFQECNYKVWRTRYVPLDATPLAGLPGEGLRELQAQRLPVLDAVRDNQKIMLIGAAGAGKTTSLCFLSYAVNCEPSLLEIKENLEADYLDICIYVELGRLRAPSGLSSFQCILILIGQSLHAQGAFQGPPALSAVQEIFENRRILLLLDGLNEVHSAIRNICLQGIEDLAKRYPNSKYVITARPQTVTPLAGWQAFSVCQLDDQKIGMFVENSSGHTDVFDLNKLVRDMRANLLRTPLHLYFVNKLYQNNINGLENILSDRCRIMSYFVNFLFQKEAEEHSDRIDKQRWKEILQNLAVFLQITGQSVLLDDIRRYLSTEKELGNGLDHILTLMCQRGFLVLDGVYIRFWHSAMQEYFFAASVAEEWRGSNREVGPPARKIAALFRDPQNQDALTYLSVHLSANEMIRAVDLAFQVNPPLAASLIDDLSVTDRSSAPVVHFIQRFDRIAHALKRYSRLYVSSWWETAALLQIAAAAVGIFVIGEHKPPQAFFSIIQCMMLFLPFSIAALVYGRWSGIYLAKDRLPAVFSAITFAHNPWLKLQLTHIVQKISQSRLARSDVKRMARAVGSSQIQHDPRALLMDDGSLYISIITLGYIRQHDVTDILDSIVKMNNAYSIAAVDALTLRLRRFPDEKERIIHIFSECWRSGLLDLDINLKIKKGLVLAGKTIDKPSKLTLQRLLLAGQLAGASLAVFVGIIGSLAGALFIVKSGLLLLLLCLGFWMIPVWVLRDARRLGAGNIQGYFGYDGHTPRYYSFMCIVFVFGYFAHYIVTRRRIARNAKRVDWASISSKGLPSAPLPQETH